MVPGPVVTICSLNNSGENGFIPVDPRLVTCSGEEQDRLNGFSPHLCMCTNQHLQGGKETGGTVHDGEFRSCRVWGRRCVLRVLGELSWMCNLST